MRDPYTDLEINCRSQLSILEACRQHNPERQGRLRRHAPGLRQARLAAGRRDAPRAADRRQRHQQGRRRVLPPRLQQRLRRARLLAAADERLRPAPADQAQPPGLHRLVHPARARGPRRSRSSATARSCATSSTSTTPPTRSCARARATRATARSSTSAATEPISHRDLADAPGRGRRVAVACESSTWPPEKKAIDIGSFYADSTQVHARPPAGRRACRCARACAARSTFYRAHLAALRRRRRDGRSAHDAGAHSVHVARARARTPPAVAAAIDRVIARGWFMLGPGGRGVRARVRRARAAPAHAVGVGTGTDAIALILRALGIGPGDEVITTPLSAAYTRARDHDGRRAPGVRRHRSGAAHARSGRGRARPITPRTRAILPVHLYGQPADMARARARRARATASRSSRTAARRTSRPAAGRPVGTIGAAGAFSFYPTKNLGALGDGGAVVTNDAALADAAQAPAQRRADRPLPPRGARRELAARRDAGGDPARAAAAPRRLDRRGAARWPPAYRARLAGAPVAVPRRSATRGTSIICSSSAATAARRAAGAPGRARHRDARSTTRCRSRASRRWRGAVRPTCPVADARLRRGAVASAASVPGRRGRRRGGRGVRVRGGLAPERT